MRSWLHGIGSIIILLFSVCFANDMELTLGNGVVLLLHTDNTWSYKKPTKTPVTKDMIIDISEGESVLVRKDFTWDYTSPYSDIPDAPTNADSDMSNAKSKQVSGAHSKGYAQSPNKKDAYDLAYQNAQRYLTQQIVLNIEFDGTIEKMASCIEVSDKKIDVKESFSQMWNIEVKMSLNEEQIRSILRCAEQ